MLQAPLPPNEAQRLAALYDYAILDTLPETAFDDLTRLAAHICEMPIALISLIDSDRQWFKSSVGIEETETPREIAFCAHTILEPNLLIVPDAAQDPRFADNPLVTGVPFIRFYAGMPLVTPDGYALGTLCIADQVPRDLTLAQQDALRTLGRLAVTQLELRRQTATLAREMRERQATTEALQDSEQRFRTLYDDNPAMYFTVSATGIVLSVNRFGAAQLGYTPEELTGQPLLSLLHEDHKEAAGRSLAAAFADPGHTAEWELQKVRKDGTLIWVRELVRVLPPAAAAAAAAAKNEPVALVICEDVTERTRVEALLEESRAFSNAVLASLPDHIGVLDRAGTLTYVNASWERFALANGATPLARVGVGANYLDVCRRATGEDEKTAHEACAGIQSVLDGSREHFSMEYSCHSPTAHRWFLLQVAQLQGTSGKVIVSHMNITERKSAEAALQAASTQVLLHLQKTEMLGQLAGGMAHDFNNLLTIIMSYADAMAMSLGTQDPLRNDLDEIQKAVRRAAVLTHGLLAFSRQQVYQPVIVNLHATIADTMPILIQATGKHIALTLSPEPAHCHILADVNQLEQVLLNLTFNARDAMPQGGCLTIATEDVTRDMSSAWDHLDLPPGRYVRLTVSDTGIGMDEETQRHMFEPFFTTKARGSGTGLGLATVCGIVTHHGGGLYCSSKPGKGTTFELYFPSTDARAAVPPKPTTARARSGTLETTILLVEDEDHVRAPVLKTLSLAGYTVVDVGSPIEALKLIEHGPTIHLLLTDMKMPDMNGDELARRAKARRPDIKVIYMSGFTDSAPLHDGDAFLAKPFAFDELMQTVHTVLNTTPSPSPPAISP